MNCCDDYGQCTQGANCCARATPLLTPKRIQASAETPNTSDDITAPDDDALVYIGRAALLFVGFCLGIAYACYRNIRP